MSICSFVVFFFYGYGARRDLPVLTYSFPTRRSSVLLGYDNVDIRVGDGTRGLMEDAPFDAILVAAGGPGVPGALKQQLKVGGRLVIPVDRKSTRLTSSH